ncbi:MAG: hypothetical protein FJ319_00100 [SAR202 cluster bacterium]|nr:hypothetical protein [SAR202 cluster bacterium]
MKRLTARKTRLLTPLAVALTALAVLTAASSASAQSADDALKLDSSLFPLAPQLLPDGYPNGAGDSPLTLDPWIRTRDNQVLIEIYAQPGRLQEAIAATTRWGSEVTDAHAPADLFAAWVPVPILLILNDEPSIKAIAATPIIYPEVIGEGYNQINAPAWAAAGYNGAGVKVAVVDSGFQGYQNLLGSELPQSVTINGTFFGDASRGINGNTDHGVYVAQSMYDIAPGAQYYFVNPGTVTGFLNAVDYLISQNVRVANMSLVWFGHYGDGSDVISQKVQQARDAGITWVNSAGNHAMLHWRGTWRDADNDGIMEFSGSDETNNFNMASGGVTLMLRWNDAHTAPGNDFQVCLSQSTGQLDCSVD